MKRTLSGGASFASLALIVCSAACGSHPAGAGFDADDGGGPSADAERPPSTAVQATATAQPSEVT